MKKVARANADEPVVPVPPVVKPIEVEFAVRLVVIHDENTQVVVGVLPLRATPSIPPPLVRRLADLGLYIIRHLIQ